MSHQALDVLCFWFFIKEYFSFSFKQKLIANEHERQMSKKFYFFYFSKLMSTRVTNFRYPASLGGESGSMAKQSLMSWGSFSSTHITGNQMCRSLTPSTCCYTLHMGKGCPHPHPVSLAHHSVSVQFSHFRSYPCIFMPSFSKTILTPDTGFEK